MTPNIDDIRHDDELLDALGARQAPRSADAVAGVLGDWVREIDAPDRPAPAGRYARAGSRGTARLGVIAAITVATLSISGVAAAVGGVPVISGVVKQIGLVHRSADFGSGAAAGPVSTSAPTPLPTSADPSTAVGSSTTTDGSIPVRGLPVGGSSVEPTLAETTSTLPRRVLPGAIALTFPNRTPPHHPGTPPWTMPGSPVHSTPSSSDPSESTTSATSSPTSSSSPSSSSSGRSTPPPTIASTTQPPAPSPTPSRTPKPTRTPKPSRTPRPSRTPSPSVTSSTPPTLSSSTESPTAGSSSTESSSTQSSATQSSSAESSGIGASASGSIG